MDNNNSFGAPNAAPNNSNPMPAASNPAANPAVNPATNPAPQAVTPAQPSPTPATSGAETDTKDKKKNKADKPKKKHRFLKFLVIVTLLIVGFVAVKSFIRKKNGETDVVYTHDYEISSVRADALLEQDFEDGYITSDQYFYMLAALYFQPDILPERYTSSDTVFLQLDLDYFFDAAERHVDSITPEMAQAITQLSLGSGLFDWDVTDEEIGLAPDAPKISTAKASSHDQANIELTTSEDCEPKSQGIVSEIINLPDYNIFCQDGSLNLGDFCEHGNTRKLNKVRLSSDGNFLIYYSTEGVHKVTEEQVNLTEKVLVDTVVEYKEKYNLDFSYSASAMFLSNPTLESMTETPYYLLEPAFERSKLKAEKLLAENGIPREKILTAMPIYMLDILSQDAVAWYNSDMGTLATAFLRRLGELPFVTNQDILLMSSTYAFPFLNLNSSVTDEESIGLVASHELFHHYQKLYCGAMNGAYYADCATNSLFVTEGTANMLSSNMHNDITPPKIFNRSHATIATSNADDPIDKVGNTDECGRLLGATIGYGAYIWQDTYKNIVNDGTKKLFDSMNQKDSLSYLLSVASLEERKKLAETYARQLLMQDYENPNFFARQENKETGGITVFLPKNRAELKKNQPRDDSLKATATHYYYFNASDFGANESIRIEGNNNTEVLVFGKRGEKYELDSTIDNEVHRSVVIRPEDFVSPEIVVAITDYGSAVAQVGGRYTISIGEVYTGEAYILEPQVFSKESTPIDLSGKKYTCTREYIDRTGETMFRNKDSYKIGFNKKGEINQLHHDAESEPLDDEDYYSWGVPLATVWQFVTDLTSHSHPNALYWYGWEDKKVQGHYLYYKNLYDVVQNKYPTVSSNSKEEIIRGFIRDGFTCEAE